MRVFQSFGSGLSAPVYRDFTNELVKAGLAAHLFDHLDPIAASFAFAGIDQARLGFYRQYGIDSRYYARAKERRIAIVALESATEHLRAVRPVSSRDSEEVVKGFLRDRADMKAHLEELVKAWERGDESALVRLILNGGPDSGLLKRVISDRTSRWLPQIDKLLLEPRNVFVIVGVGHLVGNGGLLELLKLRGLEVTQL